MRKDVQIMYGVAGERRLAEWEVSWLPGYERSAPVRIGNAAVDQRQLDVYGEVMDALTLGRQAGLGFDKHTWSLQRQLLDFLEKHWDEPDEGIWEVRGPRRHFVHSKVMAWVAFDRAIHLVEQGNPGPLERWRAIRDEIHAQVLEQGYDASRGVFTQYYGSAELDASVLLIPEVGFLPPDDPRVVSTVRVIKRELMRDGLVLRYTQPAKAVSGSGRADVDGLPGRRGRVPRLQLLAGQRPAPDRRVRRGRRDLRAAAGAAQRSRPAQRGVRPALRPPGRQHPAGLQPRAADPGGAQPGGPCRGPLPPDRRPDHGGRQTAPRTQAEPHMAWSAGDRRAGTGHTAGNATLMGSHATPPAHSGRKRP